MKFISKTLVVGFLLLQVSFAWSSPAIGQVRQGKVKKTETMKCWASMSCENCKAKIEKNLPFEKGVTGLSVDLPTKMLTITYKPEKTSQEKLEKAIQKLGFKTEIVPDTKLP